MTQDEFGKDAEFYPIHRSFLASTDNTKLFISPEKVGTHCKDNEMLVSSVHDKKLKSITRNHVMTMMMKMQKECVSNLPLTLTLMAKEKYLICMLQYQV